MSKIFRNQKVIYFYFLFVNIDITIYLPLCKKLNYR